MCVGPTGEERRGEEGEGLIGGKALIGHRRNEGRVGDLGGEGSTGGKGEEREGVAGWRLRRERGVTDRVR